MMPSGIHGQTPDYMELAFAEAALAVGNTDPNPPVGAVLVDPASGEILGRGHTRRAGLDHAEVCAVKNAVERFGPEAPRGAHLYVTLEPCSHHGRTPPCTGLIIRSGISKVVIACQDPTEKVEGIKALHEAGVKTELLGVTGEGASSYDEAAFWTLGGFFHMVKKGRPRIFLKWAQTRGGFLAPATGESGPVSSPLSKETVYRWRRLLHATLATPGTVVTDRPLLSARYGFQELKIPGFVGRMLDFPAFVDPKEQICPPRYLMSPAIGPHWSAHEWLTYAQNRDSLCGKDGWFFTDEGLAREARSLGLETFLLDDFDELGPLFDVIAQKGALQVLIEAGPLFAEKISRSGWMDMGIAYLSPREAPWEQQGRGFWLSELLARQGVKALEHEGFSVQFDAQTGEDRLLIFQSPLS